MAEERGDSAGVFKKFVKYTEIETLNHLPIPAPAASELTGEEVWCVTEKVHGCNFSFTTDGTSISCAKRSARLGGEEKFHGYQALRDKYTSAVFTIRKLIAERVGAPPDTIVTIYGEVFGGKYPHPDVKAAKNISCVQKGVYYCPWIEFYAFDVYCPIVGFVDYDVCLEVFKAAGIFHAVPLLVGTLKQATEFSPLFETTIPGRLGLPKIADNIAEGVVIKRIKGSRPIFKNKNERFAEITGKAYGSAIAHARKVQSAGGEQPDVAASSTVKDTEEYRIAKYVCENRLYNVISKIGTVTAADSAKLIGMLAKDAITDFAKDELAAKGNPAGDLALWNASVTKETKALVGKVCARIATDLVKAFMKKIDGASGTDDDDADQ